MSGATTATKDSQGRETPPVEPPSSGGCPRCGFPEPTRTECPRCGVVFAKLDRPAAAAKKPPVVSEVSSSGRENNWLDVAMAVAFVGALAMIVWRWKQPPPAPEPAVALEASQQPRPASGAGPTGASETRLVTSEPQGPPPRAWTPGPSSWSAPPSGLPPTRTEGYATRSTAPAALGPEDGAAFMTLARAIGTRSEIDSSHIDQVERLHTRYPTVPEVDQALEDVFELAAAQANAQGRPVDAVRYREEAAEQLPERARVWLRLIAVHEERRAWPAAERVARRALSPLPDESTLHLALARALSQQGRDEEAADVLRRRLTARNDPAARAMLAQLEVALSSVAGLARRSSSHFNVMFEGQSDDALGQALVQTLEDKYSMLARTLDYEPTQAVPVILYPREVFKSTGAPSWAGATFSHGDGRIRIGTRDLSAGFVPLDLERTLTHELTHAFVFGLGRGAVPRDVNEGLAQYLSGKRLGYKLDSARVAGSNERVKVDDYYDSALSFVEYLLDHYRQPAMNDLLKYAGQTGSADQGFRRAYHQGYEETRQEWIKSLRTP